MILSPDIDLNVKLYTDFNELIQILTINHNHHRNIEQVKLH